MYSQKLYQFVADVIADKRQKTAGSQLKAVLLGQLDSIMDDFSAEFEQDNPKFDKERFEMACVK